MFKKATGQAHKINWHEPQNDQTVVSHSPTGSNEKDGTDAGHSSTHPMTDNERTYRALRVASWQAVFYLITTDILGFSSAPEAFAELGVGPGILVYVFFYLLAVFAGQIIWRLYCDYDSAKYPVTCYADLGERTFGRWVRHVFNGFQSAQLLFNVALLIIGNGQTLVSIIGFKFCYLALNIFFMLVGITGGQIRSLRNFSWFANLNIWLNIIVMVRSFLDMSLHVEYLLILMPTTFRLSPWLASGRIFPFLHNRITLTLTSQFRLLTGSLATLRDGMRRSPVSSLLSSHMEVP